MEEEEYKRLVEGFKKIFGRNLAAIAIFGSQAREKKGPGSDLDIFCIINELPTNLYQRVRMLNGITSQIVKERFSIISKTEREFLEAFPSLYLDLGLDAKIIYDKDGFLARSLARIKEIIKEAGLRRKKIGDGFIWKWKDPPKRGWEITWEGYREL